MLPGAAASSSHRSTLMVAVDGCEQSSTLISVNSVEAWRSSRDLGSLKWTLVIQARFMFIDMFVSCVVVGVYKK